MRYLFAILITLLSACLTSDSYADLIYNPQHDEALKNLQSIQSANLSMHYQCGEYSLIISIFATEAEVSGRKPSVSAKITSSENNHDISKEVSRSVSRQDVLESNMSVACNPDKGAFEITFTPNSYSTSGGGVSVINVFSDGAVEGYREF